MRRSNIVLVLGIAAFTVACSGRQAQVESVAVAPASTLEPVGMYDFVATLGSETRTGTIEIRQSAAGGYEGEARLQGESEPAVIDDLRVEGNKMIIDMTTPGDAVTFEMDFTGADFTGMIFAGQQVITMTGSKRS